MARKRKPPKRSAASLERQRTYDRNRLATPERREQLRVAGARHREKQRSNPDPGLVRADPKPITANRLEQIRAARARYREKQQARAALRAPKPSKYVEVDGRLASPAPKPSKYVEVDGKLASPQPAKPITPKPSKYVEVDGTLAPPHPTKPITPKRREQIREAQARHRDKKRANRPPPEPKPSKYVEVDGKFIPPLRAPAPDTTTRTQEPPYWRLWLRDELSRITRNLGRRLEPFERNAIADRVYTEALCAMASTKRECAKHDFRKLLRDVELSHYTGAGR